MKQKAGASSGGIVERSRKITPPSTSAWFDDFLLALESEDVTVERLPSKSVTMTTDTTSATAASTDDSVTPESGSELVKGRQASSGSCDKSLSSACSLDDSRLETSTDLDASQVETSGYNTSAFNTSILESPPSKEKVSSGSEVWET